MKTVKFYQWPGISLLIILCTFLSSCKQDNVAAPEEALVAASDGTFSIIDPCATCVDVTLYKTVSNDNESVGNVAVCQTSTQLTLTFTVSGNRERAWFNQTGFSIDGNGLGFSSLNPGLLTRQMNHGDKIRSYTWVILFSDILKNNPLDPDGPDIPVVPGDNICIAAYAVVPGPDGAGGQVWAGQINTNAGNPHPRYFCYIIKECNTPPPPTSDCFFTQGYWFAKPNGSQWPVTTINFGGYDYNYSEARAIFFSSNKKGKTDAKQAFLQGMAFKLSTAGGANPAVCAGGSTSLASIETFFTGKGKQSPSTINSYPPNSALKSAATLLSDCLNANHCDNTVSN